MDVSTPENQTAPSSTSIALAFGALGVVYGDIGTSPLYAIKECFSGEYGLALNPTNILGICSLIFWSLVVVVILKYITFVTRADNNGEGGILALLALANPSSRNVNKFSRRAITLTILGLVGAALLAADGAITPAITVLSAIEGLEVATPVFKPFILPLTIVILVALFWIQSRGTAGLAKIFAPAMMIWFLTLAVMGSIWIFKNPRILEALNPWFAIHTLTHGGWKAFLILGSVVLCVTGAEALYADLGHFGRKAISRAWYYLVFPSLVLNYFGQGALLLEKGAAAQASPFYSLVPSYLIYPLLALATVAAVIASQALISGAFSLGQQAIQLGFSPRLTVVHTSEQHKGQIYIPEINFMLMLSCLFLVIEFQSSSRLASAYGIAVVGTMTITTILLFEVARKVWQWPMWICISLISFLLTIDLTFLVANLHKIEDGGYFTLFLGSFVFIVMLTWKKGRTALARRMIAKMVPIDRFLDDIESQSPFRIKGTSIFMTSNLRTVPPALLHHFSRTGILHEKVVLLSVITEGIPTVSPNERVKVTNLRENFFEVIARYGFMQKPQIDQILYACNKLHHMDLKPNEITYYLGRENLLISGPVKMPKWQKLLFAFLTRNSLSATAYFGLPTERVIELGMQVEL